MGIFGNKDSKKQARWIQHAQQQAAREARRTASQRWVEEMTQKVVAEVEARRAEGGVPKYGPTPTGPGFEPIAGVTIDQFAVLAGGVKAGPTGMELQRLMMEEMGISQSAWTEAVAGWNERISSNPAVAERFHLLYD